jgi:tetratricopeptide (TPR) repeat protein
MMPPLLDDTPTDDPLGPVVNAFLEAKRTGLNPDRNALREAHPDLAVDLDRFFAAHDAVENLARPLREVAQAARLVADSDNVGFARRGRLAAPLPFGDYTLLEVLGSGGMGIVYRAHHAELKRDVALKQIITGPLATEADIQRFRNEAESAATLEHANIVPVHEVGENDGRHYLTMRLMEGGSLASHINDYPSDPRAAARLVAAVAHAVHHAHQRGVLHRDLKPSNILLDGAGAPHVTDFGLARRISDESTLTESGAIVGTPAYMSPEQAAGRVRDVTMATDVYALGAILYALLTGRPPFRGDSVLDTLDQVRSIEPESPRRLNPRVDRDLETIVLKSMAKESAARYGSAVEMAKDLENWMAGEPIAARPVGRLIKAWRWAQRNRVVAGLLAAVGVLSIAGVVELFVSRAAIARKNVEISRQRDRAKQAVDDMYTQVAERLLPNLPGMERTRRDFLRKALRYYEDEASEGNGSNAVSRTERAKAYVRVGRIHKELSETSAAEQAYGEAVFLFEQLAKDYPDDPGPRYQLAECLNELGLVCWTRGDRARAKELFSRGLAAAEESAVTFAGQPEFRHLIASNLHNLAVLQHEVGKLPDAEAALRRAIEVRRKLVLEAPGSLPYRHGLAGDLVALAGILGDTSRQHPRAEEAEQAFRQALQIYDRLEADFGSMADTDTTAADLRNNLGDFLVRTGRPEKAEAVLRQALAARERLAARFPDVPSLGAVLGVVQINLAESLRDQGRYTEACELARRAVAHEQVALKASPKHLHYLGWLSAGHVLLAETLLSQGDAEKASEAAEAATRVLPDQPDWFYCLGSAYARCLPRLEKLTKLGGVRRRALVATVAEQSVGYLRQAIKKGYRATATGLQDDPSLRSLRPFENYQRLIQELERK